MKLFTTVLAGALLTGAGLFSVTGCSDDEAPAAGAGGSTGGSAGASGTSGASGTGGRGGSGGSTGGSAGSGGSGGVDCTTAAGVAECKTRAASSPTCASQANCACENCTCLLQDCEAIPECIAIRECAGRTVCCSSDDTGCVGTPCTTACMAEIAAASSAGVGLAEVLAVSACVYTTNSCGRCPQPDGGAGTGGTGGTASDAGGG